MNKYIFYLILALILILLANLWIVGRGLINWSPIDYEAFGTYGDFVGGVLGTIFAAIAVYYAYETYKKSKKERIRHHFYTMLAKHNENSSCLKDGEVDFFPKNIELLRKVFNSCKDNLRENNIFKLSYFYFFYGSNLAPNSIPNKQESIEKMNKCFKNNNIQFEGVSKNLGVYFRQLFQIVAYINDQELLTYKEKYGYIKSLRATLSNEEQYLLFLNSLSTLGEAWELKASITNKNDKLITKYSLIKNIPENIPRILGDKDFETEYSKIHYEYEESNENKKKERDEWEKDYT